MTAEFGDGYRAYKERTPRLAPDFSKWRDEDEISIKPRFFVTTLRDGLAVLLAISIFESVGWAQATGWLPVLVRLP